MLHDHRKNGVAYLRSEAGRYSLAINTEPAPDLPVVTADRVQLQQVLMNLMLNGIDAINEGKTVGALSVKSTRNSNHDGGGLGQRYRHRIASRAAGQGF
jgi:signal transduction histidine kinase